MRRMPARGSEPPYDGYLLCLEGCRLPPLQVQGTLALSFAVAGRQAVVARVSVIRPAPERPRPGPPALRLVPPLDESRQGQPAGRSSRRPPPREERAADPLFGGRRQPGAGKLARAIIEVLAGVRPVAQVLSWTTAAVYADIVALVPSEPGETARPGGGRALISSLRVSHPSVSVAEVTAIAHHDQRPQAIALGFERADDRWVCTAIELRQ